MHDPLRKKKYSNKKFIIKGVSIFTKNEDIINIYIINKKRMSILLIYHASKCNNPNCTQFLCKEIKQILRLI